MMVRGRKLYSGGGAIGGGMSGGRGGGDGGSDGGEGGGGEGGGGDGAYVVVQTVTGGVVSVTVTPSASVSAVVLLSTSGVLSVEVVLRAATFTRIVMVNVSLLLLLDL